MMTYEQAKALLESKKQTQLLRYYDELDAAGKEKLLTAIENLNWDFEDALANPVDMSGAGRDIKPISGLRLSAIEAKKAEFEKIGVEAIKAGKVAAVLLAGGMGTRLGVDGPKGAYDIGVTKPLYIFEQQMKNLQEVNDKCGVFVPLYIMTSDKNHEQTTSFWKEHNYFGYPETEVKFFKQDMAPAVDFNGKIFLETKDTPALSPNGNGGWFGSLMRAGLGEDLHKRGVEWLNIYAVDNVLQRIADPVFVGATIDSGVNCGAKVICKTNPYEKVGVLCMDGNKPDIIEYYELTEEMANQKDENGDLAYLYGAIMNYLFRLSKLEEIVSQKIPVHIVEKKIESVCEDGVTRKPEKENGKKFETLAVDLIKPMGSVLPFEVVREKEFAPIKNKTGVDSVESARELLKLNGVEL
jgi:UDP-N-acetylglucosamine/UDP-N-acetylgalactosamine diphosphorylase